MRWDRPKFRCVVPVALAPLGVALASGACAAGGRLTDLSLEELSNIEIISGSKRAERLSDAPLSIFVITEDDIRRSGATSLPEALRLAPNLQVARASSMGYVISARGFSDSAANKMLVLIDGRSVYTPLFSGVFWDVQDVMLEDVDRIEVISGPGGTLWGVNAVNGVINVLTKGAQDTPRGLLAAGASNRESQVSMRWGGTLGDDGRWRLYAKHFDHRHTRTASGDADDAWYKSQVGMRADWQRGPDGVSVMANAYRGREGQPMPGTISVAGVTLDLGDISVAGANVVARWARRLEGGSEISLQGSLDHTERVVPPTFAERLDIVDLQVQHTSRPAARHTLVWGAEYRQSWDRLNNSEYVAFLPAHVQQRWSSLFVQDEIGLREDLRLTLGARIERNPYTGAEFLPNARLAWKPAPGHLLWSALSRTVRSPSRLDRDAHVPGRPPFLLDGGPGMRSETAEVFELGYRGQPTGSTSYSVTAFHAAYDHLRTLRFAPDGTTIVVSNDMKGTVRGIEMWGTWQVSQAWWLRGGYNRLWQDLRLRPGGQDAAAPDATEGKNPEQSWMLRSSLDLGARGELDLTVRHVSALRLPDVPSYLAVDMRFGWRLRSDLELSVSGQNLFGTGHAEYTARPTRSEFGSSVFVKLVSRF